MNKPGPQTGSQPATAPVLQPSQSPQAANMPALDKPAAPNKLGPQNRPPLASSPVSQPSRPSEVASLEAGEALVRTQTTPAQEVSVTRHLDPNEIATLLKSGLDFLQTGDLAAARLSLRRAAEAGSAEAALALGSTYDPSTLKQLGAVGIAPDVARARQWYEEAANLGSSAATERLTKLPQTGQ
ncbi:MAG: hypothetical protein WCA56_18395 [Xanthobacteraceae bacterium]